MPTKTIQEMLNENIYCVNARFSEEGTDFAKIRRDDSAIADLIQKYCGAYETIERATAAQNQLLGEMQKHLETVYPASNILPGTKSD